MCDHVRVSGLGTLELVAAPSDVRFTSPLYTVRDAARLLRVPPPTFREWVFPHHGARPLVAVIPSDLRHEAEIPFAGLVEGLVIAALRRPRKEGKAPSMQYIRKAVSHIEQKIGLEHALASRRLLTDGAKILYDHRQDEEDAQLLVEVTTDNVVFTEVVQRWLQLITFGGDDWAEELTLPTEKPGILRVSPRRAFGRPLLTAGGAPLLDVLERFYAYEPVDSIAEDFGVSSEVILDAVRAYPSLAA